MKKIIFLSFVTFNLLYSFASAQQDTLFLINRQEGSQKVIETMDSGKLQFYDINDSFFFTSNEKGNYCLLNLTDNNVTKGRIKLKKPFNVSPILFSEFRGNAPNIGIYQANLFSQFHIDEGINYIGGITVGEILKMSFISEYNAVLLHILHDKNPVLYQLWLLPCYEIKNKKTLYIDVPTLVTTPTALYESKNISNIRVHEESAKAAFLAGDSILMVFDLKNTTHRSDYYDFGNSFDFGFYNEDSIFIVRQDGRASMLSLITHQSRTVYSTQSLIGMQDIQVVKQHLFYTKEDTLYINKISDCVQLVEGNQIKSDCVQPLEAYSFNNKIISYKVSKDGTKILVHTSGCGKKR